MLLHEKLIRRSRLFREEYCLAICFDNSFGEFQKAIYPQYIKTAFDFETLDFKIGMICYSVKNQSIASTIKISIFQAFRICIASFQI